MPVFTKRRLPLPWRYKTGCNYGRLHCTINTSINQPENRCALQRYRPVVVYGPSRQRYHRLINWPPAAGSAKVAGPSLARQPERNRVEDHYRQTKPVLWKTDGVAMHGMILLLRHSSLFASGSIAESMARPTKRHFSWVSPLSLMRQKTEDLATLQNGEKCVVRHGKHPIDGTQRRI